MPLITFEGNVGLTSREAFDIAIQWLKKIDAKIIETKGFNYIKAKHGTYWKIEHKPDYKKEIEIYLNEVSGKELIFIVTTKPLFSDGILTNGQKIKSNWWFGLFTNLFSEIGISKINH